MKRKILLFISIFILFGCKVDVSADVNISDLFNNQHKMVAADINFEVPSCNDFDDSRNDSKSLIELKNTMPSIFRDSKFVECYKSKFDSFAHFKIPVSVGSADSPEKINDTDIILSSSKENKVIASIYLNDGLIKRIKQYEKKSRTKLDFNISITLHKDIKEPLLAKQLSVFVTTVDGETRPVIASDINWASTNPIKFTLSDVAKASLFQNGAYPFLVDADIFNKEN